MFNLIPNLVFASNVRFIISFLLQNKLIYLIFILILIHLCYFQYFLLAWHTN